MEDRRRLLSGWPNHSSTRTSSHGKPPRPPTSPYENKASFVRSAGSAYHHPVPAWEKRFCTSVCSVPWRKICDAKVLIPIHKNIANWDDSGALEAFKNAKARFLAQEINGGSDDIPLPDPDMYIDNVDFDAAVDPNLVADLENDQPPPPGRGCIIFADKPDPGTGWGDAEQNNTGAEPFSSGWDSKPNRGTDNAHSGNAWDNSWGAGGDNSWDKGWDSSFGNDNWGSGNARNDYSWGVGRRRDNSWDYGNNGSRGTWENKNNNNSGLQRKGRKRDGGGHFGIKSMKRLRVDNYRVNDNSHWLYDKQPLAMW